MTTMLSSSKHAALSIVLNYWMVPHLGWNMHYYHNNVSELRERLTLLRTQFNHDATLDINVAQHNFNVNLKREAAFIDVKWIKSIKKDLESSSSLEWLINARSTDEEGAQTVQYSVVKGYYEKYYVAPALSLQHAFIEVVEIMRNVYLRISHLIVNMFLQQHEVAPALSSLLVYRLKRWQCWQYYANLFESILFNMALLPKQLEISMAIASVQIASILESPEYHDSEPHPNWISLIRGNELIGACLSFTDSISDIMHLFESNLSRLYVLLADGCSWYGPSVHSVVLEPTGSSLASTVHNMWHHDIINLKRDVILLKESMFNLRPGGLDRGISGSYISSIRHSELEMFHQTYDDIANIVSLKDSTFMDFETTFKDLRNLHTIIIARWYTDDQVSHLMTCKQLCQDVLPLIKDALSKLLFCERAIITNYPHFHEYDLQHIFVSELAKAAHVACDILYWYFNFGRRIPGQPAFLEDLIAPVIGSECVVETTQRVQYVIELIKECILQYRDCQSSNLSHESKSETILPFISTNRPLLEYYAGMCTESRIKDLLIISCNCFTNPPKAMSKVDFHLSQSIQKPLQKALNNNMNEDTLLDLILFHQTYKLIAQLSYHFPSLKKSIPTVVTEIDALWEQFDKLNDQHGATTVSLVAQQYSYDCERLMIRLELLTSISTPMTNFFLVDPILYQLWEKANNNIAINLNEIDWEGIFEFIQYLESTDLHNSVGAANNIAVFKALLEWFCAFLEMMWLIFDTFWDDLHPVHDIWIEALDIQPFLTSKLSGLDAIIQTGIDYVDVLLDPFNKQYMDDNSSEIWFFQTTIAYSPEQVQHESNEIKALIHEVASLGLKEYHNSLANIFDNANEEPMSKECREQHFMQLFL